MSADGLRVEAFQEFPRVATGRISCLPLTCRAAFSGVIAGMVYLDTSVSPGSGASSSAVVRNCCPGRAACPPQPAGTHGSGEAARTTIMRVVGTLIRRTGWQVAAAALRVDMASMNTKSTLPTCGSPVYPVNLPIFALFADRNTRNPLRRHSRTRSGTCLHRLHNARPSSTLTGRTPRKHPRIAQQLHKRGILTVTAGSVIDAHQLHTTVSSAGYVVLVSRAVLDDPC